MAFSEFGDGREERLGAFLFEMRLRSSPEMTRRREAYHRQVALARDEAKRIGKAAVIEQLMAVRPPYEREILETEDERLGEGALVERYARTFYKKMEILSDD